MALHFVRGTTKAFIITLDGCNDRDYIWTNFNKTYVRLAQGDVVIEKELEALDDDATSGIVFYTQEDTLKFSSNQKAQLQVFSIAESDKHQSALKTPIYDVIVGPSLWDDARTVGIYEKEAIKLNTPIYPDPIGHVAYDYLHINIDEYSGIIGGGVETVIAELEGEELYCDVNTETLYSK